VALPVVLLLLPLPVAMTPRGRPVTDTVTRAVPLAVTANGRTVSGSAVSLRLPVSATGSATGSLSGGSATGTLAA